MLQTSPVLQLMLQTLLTEDNLLASHTGYTSDLHTMKSLLPVIHHAADLDMMGSLTCQSYGYASGQPP